jgi:asparagine synthetase B (glutamine-hydrolysing)
MKMYLQAFDSSVDQMVAGDEPMCATLSGGLDSTFVVASLARLATEDRPVHAFSHRPHPDAQLRSAGHWDPDDYEFAERLAAHYPGKVILHPLVNDELVQPLDAAASSAEDRWVPAVNPSNQIWVDAAMRQAAALGAGAVFMGENGNSAFSYDHPYAAGYYLRRWDPQSMADLVRSERRRGLSVTGALKKSWVGPLTAPLRRRVRGRGHAVRWFRRQHEPLFAGSGRTAYLNWLRADRSFRAQGQPNASGVILADPFTAATVLEVAARIEPAEWRRGPLNRSFARRAGAGRVPDEVRLRTRRGGQSWDAWFVIRHQRERYLDETRALCSTPVMSDLVDVESMMADLQAWPWGQVQGPTLSEVIAAERLLHVGQFTRMTIARLAA